MDFMSTTSRNYPYFIFSYSFPHSQTLKIKISNWNSLLLHTRHRQHNIVATKSLQLTCEPAARVLCLQFPSSQPFCNIINSREWRTPTNKNIARMRNARHKFQLSFHRTVDHEWANGRRRARSVALRASRSARGDCVMIRARLAARVRGRPLLCVRPAPAPRPAPRTPPLSRHLRDSPRKQPTYPRTRLIMY